MESGKRGSRPRRNSEGASDKPKRTEQSQRGKPRPERFERTSSRSGSPDSGVSKGEKSFDEKKRYPSTSGTTGQNKKFANKRTYPASRGKFSREDGANSVASPKTFGRFDKNSPPKGTRTDDKPFKTGYKPFAKPFEKGKNARFEKDRTAEGRSEPARPSFRKFDRNDGPARPSFRKSETGDGPEKPSFRKFEKGDEPAKPSFPKFEKSGEKISSRDRQVGSKLPPRYDSESLKSKIPYKARAKFSEEKQTNILRLNRYISNSGLCSRREADELIASGMIKVNGKPVTEMGYKVLPGDTVTYGKNVLSRERLMYVLLNKPKDYITTREDPNERKTVMNLVDEACRERIYPVGRLDRNTTGLLLLTNDGELTEKLTHPSSEIKKIYQVELNKPFIEEHFQSLKAGIELEDGLIKPDDLAYITPDAEVVGIEIHSGKNRIVRRIFEHLGYEVLKLDRTSFAGLTKKDLPRGKWRFLKEKEVIMLKYLV